MCSRKPVCLRVCPFCYNLGGIADHGYVVVVIEDVVVVVLDVVAVVQFNASMADKVSLEQIYSINHKSFPAILSSN